jgi:hypothetical protein
MKYRYDRATGRIVEKLEPKPEVFDVLPPSKELTEQLEALDAMQRSLRAALLGRE